MAAPRLAAPKGKTTALRQWLEARQVLAAEARWTPLAGGRCNWVFRVEDSPEDLVCKLFRAEAGTPLFPNDAESEHRILLELSGTGLAPAPRILVKTPLGPCLIYHHVPGRAGRREVTSAAALLGRVHKRPVPAGLRRIVGGSDEIIAQSSAMLNSLGKARSDRLRRCQPDLWIPATTRAHLLHGDPVPANIISGQGSSTLLDWQCPAAGDPCEDIAIFLSPAMQTLYGSGPLTPDEREDFLAAYPDPAVAERCRALAPLHHWRMAIYCAWKGARGEADYASAMALELEALEKHDRQHHTAAKHPANEERADHAPA